MCPLNIEIFCDEQFIEDKFICIGAFFIPIHDKNKIINNLLNLRCLNDQNHTWYKNFNECPINLSCKEYYHNYNNCEIHYKKIGHKSNSLIQISKKWLKFFIRLNIINRPIRFYLLYLNLNNLEFDRFGDSHQKQNIYNRFFRTIIAYGIKSFFDGRMVIIKNVFHDHAPVEHHYYFPSKNLSRLQSDFSNFCNIENKNVIFINSDHKDENNFYYESHLIQLIDLFMGTTSQLLFKLSNNPDKIKLTNIIRPLIERLLKNPKNVNSRYNYYSRQCINAFPKIKIDKNIYVKTFDGNLIKLNSNLFYKPEILLHDLNIKTILKYYINKNSHS
ncbi:MAG: hypothetical protein ACTSVV_12960 [Promethearchaeota archaeon]